MKKLILIVLLTGCLSPLESETRDSKMRLQIAENEARTAEAELHKVNFQWKTAHAKKLLKSAQNN